MSTRSSMRVHNNRVPTPTEAGWSALRQFRRKAVIWGAKLEAEDGVFDCIVLDLSLGGARLRCDHAFSLQAPATLLLDKFGTFPAEVVWTAPPEVGVQFTDAPAEVATRFGDIMPLGERPRR